MKYTPAIKAAAENPEQMELLYQKAVQGNEETEFRTDLQAEHFQSPDNLLLSAWQARFEHLPLPKVRRAVNWGLAVVLGGITGVLLWAFTDPRLVLPNQYPSIFPYYLILWAPLATITALIFLAAGSKRNYLFTVICCAVLVIAGVYVILMLPGLASGTSRDYFTLMVIHLPLLCWIAIGISVLQIGSTPANRFAFLIKSVEVMVTAGVYLAFGIAFGMITLGMFSALDITPPGIVIRLAIAGGFGMIPIMAVATMYDTHFSPGEQDFSSGLSKFVFTIVRLLLPLTLLVLVVYIFVIPFNFMAPYRQRELLIIYNVMQFAIVGLLISATPIKVDDLTQNLQVWIRRGMVVVAILALAISLYALSAVAYRTALDGLTQNRLAILGWNVINIVILFALVFSQVRKGLTGWNVRLQNVFSRATTAYLVWSLFLVILLPLVFR